MADKKIIKKPVEDEMNKSFPKLKPYMLPNRKAFSDFITRTFLKYRKEIEKSYEEDLDKDPCLSRSGESEKKLLPYQELIRDYMSDETPYRGILLYHGLGSGKTFESIAVALSLHETRHVYVMLPASLRSNYMKEIEEMGRPLYAFENNWTFFRYDNDLSLKKQAKELLGVSDDFINERVGIWITDSSKEPNYISLSASQKKEIDKQIEDVISLKFTFFNYNNSTWNTKELLDVDSEGNINKNIFHNSVVVIDEAHLFIGNIKGESKRLEPIYKALLTARDCRIILLSGTPIVNEPFELSIMFNMLRGLLDTYYIQPPSVASGINVEQILKKISTIDTIEYNSNKRKWMITRNPHYFVSIFGKENERLGVKYDKNQNKEETKDEYVSSLINTLKQSGWELTTNDITYETTTLFPTDRIKFQELFVDLSTLKAKNQTLFMKRIMGLVSYFKGIDPRMLPERKDIEETLIQVPMSHTQYLAYQRERVIEIKMEASKVRSRNAGEDEVGSYRAKSRIVCNYAVPPELKDASILTEFNNENQEDTPENAAMRKALKAKQKEQVLENIMKDPSRFFSLEALEMYSPKMLQIYKTIKEGKGTHLVYSQFITAEGLGFFGEVLNLQGYRELKVKKEEGDWVLDVDTTSNKPFYSYFTGEEEPTEREIYRLIFNNNLKKVQKDYPRVWNGLRKIFGDEMTNLRGEIIKVMMISAAGAAGIDLKNVRQVHIMEPYWNPAMMDQVIGRAIRVCSHSELPPEERNVKANIYLTIFNDDIRKPSEDNSALLRKMDSEPKRFVSEFNPNAMIIIEAATTDEHIYNIAYKKKVLADQFTLLMKDAAIDCEIHKPLHSKNEPQINCLSFDSSVNGEDISYYPDVKLDQTDSEINMNIIKVHRSLQKIRIKNFVFILRVDTGEVYDYRIFESSNKLLKIGNIEDNKLVLED